LSIVVVGVGDGPWVSWFCRQGEAAALRVALSAWVLGQELMEVFDDELPTRRFDNFQFVPFDQIMAAVCCSCPSLAGFGLRERLQPRVRRSVRLRCRRTRVRLMDAAWRGRDVDPRLRECDVHDCRVQVPAGCSAEAHFAMHALQEIPEQFKLIRELRLM
jgi:hypothetical protein